MHSLQYCVNMSLRGELIISPTKIQTACGSVLDRTAIEFDFDYSCLEGLDEQLLFFPTDAFAVICWADAVDDPSSKLSTEDTQEIDVAMLGRPGYFSDSSDSDSTECHTPKDQGVLKHIQILGDTVNSYGINLSPVDTKSCMLASTRPPALNFTPQFSACLFV